MNYPKLHPVFKKKWLAALRSGKYKQGRGYLLEIDDQGNKTYCCLGVACKVVRIGDQYLDSELITQDMVRAPKMLMSGKHVDVLTQMNDGGTAGIIRKNFKQIANWIEKNL